jgi:diketogulonate reductase-like aldo/keto reductase
MKALAARDPHTTPAMLMYAWLINCGITPLSGTCSQQHMADDVRVAKGEVKVSDDVVKALCMMIKDPDMVPQ